MIWGVASSESGRGGFSLDWPFSTLVHPLWKAVWRVLKKLKIELPFDPAIPLLSKYPEKTMTRKDTCASTFTAIPSTFDQVT